MSDPKEGDIDNGPQPVEQSPSVAPSDDGEPQGSTPAPGDTPAAEPEEPKAEEAEKQSRREARAFATLRRENRELYRRLGGMEAILQQQLQQAQSPEGTGQTRSPPVNEGQEELNRSILDKIEDEGEEYEKVVEKITAPNFPISVGMRDFLATSDKPAIVAKFLADNPAEARRISLLSDRAADRAMEQLEARVAPKAAPRITKAPPPVRTVGSSGRSGLNELYDSKTSMDRYAELRKKSAS